MTRYRAKIEFAENKSKYAPHVELELNRNCWLTR